MSYSQVVHKNRSLTSVVAVAVSALALSACSGGGVRVGEDAGDEVTSSSASTTSVTTSAITSATTSEATQTSTSEETTTKAPGGAIDGVQIVWQSQEEVSPSIIQGSFGYASVDAEWMAVSGGAAYSGEKCATVITYTDPAGNILSTDRVNTCSGSTEVQLRESRNQTGIYTVKVSIAPWDDTEAVTEAEQTFEFIAAGT